MSSLEFHQPQQHVLAMPTEGLQHQSVEDHYAIACHYTRRSAVQHHTIPHRSRVMDHDRLLVEP